MNFQPRSIRPFIGAYDFKLSTKFYEDLGFEKIEIAHNMNYFKTGNFGFYLQDYDAKEWIDNSMIFLEVEDSEEHLRQLKAKVLERTYPKIRISEMNYREWGQEFFFYDPSGILWHVGEFKE